MSRETSLLNYLDVEMCHKNVVITNYFAPTRSDDASEDHVPPLCPPLDLKKGTSHSQSIVSLGDRSTDASASGAGAPQGSGHPNLNKVIDAYWSRRDVRAEIPAECSIKLEGVAAPLQMRVFPSASVELGFASQAAPESTPRSAEPVHPSVCPPATDLNKNPGSNLVALIKGDVRGKTNVPVRAALGL